MIIPILADFKGYYLVLFLSSSISFISSVSWNLFEQNSLNEIHISKMTEWNDVEHPSTPSLAMCRAVRNISLSFWFLKAKLGKMQSKPLILTVSVTILLLSILFLYSKTPRRSLPFFFFCDLLLPFSRGRRKNASKSPRKRDCASFIGNAPD